MKGNKKRMGLVIGLVCMVVLALLLLRMCGAPGGEEAATEPTETTLMDLSETTEPTEVSTEPTEESTEPTEESTDPTEETKTVVSTNNAVGSPGSTGTSVTEPTDPTEPEEVEIIPAGVAVNPYTEVMTEYPGDFTSVKIPAGGTIYYNIYNTDGATLTVKDPDAYVMFNGTTYNPVNGVVTARLECADDNTPATLVIGNKSGAEKAFGLSLDAPVGAPCNPEVVESIDKLTATLEKGREKGYTFSWTAAEDCFVTVSITAITDGVTADVILTAGENTASLSANGVTEEKTDENGEKYTITTVTVRASRGDVVDIVAIAAKDAAGGTYPAAEVELAGSVKAACQLVSDVTLKLGSTAVKPAETTLAYVYRFQPTVTGTYKFTVTGSGAVLSYWGADLKTMTDMTAKTDYTTESNSFTVTVDMSSVGKTLLIGVSGATDCTMTVSKEA